MARLEIRAKTIKLFRAHQHPEHLPESLDLNFVEAREVGAPQGTTPVVWRLITTESIETDAQISKIIDIYKKRWLIEEFFKVLKTGCQFESHQLENIKGLLVALSIESAIAWQLLRLRDVGRRSPDTLGRELLTPCQYLTIRQLRAKRGIPFKELSVLEVTQELAMLGSHLKNNGLPGWIVLKRGIKKLNLITEGLLLAAQMKDTRIDVINL